MQLRSDDEQFLNLLKGEKSIVLLTSGKADADTVSAMLAFYHLFKGAERKITLVVPEVVPLQCQNLSESSVIKSDLGPKNLIISLDTKGSPLSKISYSQEGGIFNLIIHPKERSFEIEKIRYSYEGDKFDAFIVFGVSKISDLEDLYTKNQKEFSQVPVVNFDYHAGNDRYGSINLVDESAEGMSEALFRKIVVWGLVPSREAATALLNGIAYKGENSAKSENGFAPKNVEQTRLREELLAKEREALIQ